MSLDSLENVLNIHFGTAGNQIRPKNNHIRLSQLTMLLRLAHSSAKRLSIFHLLNDYRYII